MELKVTVININTDKAHVILDKYSILKEYLKRKGSEVRNMLVAEYSYEEDIRVKQEEAMQEGLSQGIEQMIVNALSNTKSIKQTALILSLDEQMVIDIAKAKKMNIDN